MGKWFLVPGTYVFAWCFTLGEWVILAHGDSDGVSSAALAKAFLEKQGFNVRVYFTHPVGLLGDLKEFATGASGIFVVDIALNELHCNDVLALLGEFSRSSRVVYIDHHPLLEEVKIPEGVTWIHDTCCSASELTFRYLSNLGLDPEYSRVALYGAVGDYLDETPWVKHELSKWDKRAVYLEAGIVIQGLEGSRRDYEFKRRVVNHLSANKLPSTMGELVERGLKQAVEDENLRLWVKSSVIKHGLVSYVLNPPGSAGKAATYARVYGGTLVGIAVEERKGVYVMSLRGERGVDLNRVLRKLSKDLGVNGGGHPQAAGARVEKELFVKFLEELNKQLSQISFSQQL